MDADSEIDGRLPDSQYVELAVEVFAMLADATRVRIVLALRDGELSVNHLADIVDKSPAGVSQHLAKMRLGFEGGWLFQLLFTPEQIPRFVTKL